MPPVVPVTLTVNVHEELAASVAPARLMLPLLATAVMVPPGHELERPLGFATVRPAGSVSENATPVSPVVTLVFAMVKLRLVVPPTGIDAAPNDLTMNGGPVTERLAVAVLPLPAEELTVTELFFVHRADHVGDDGARIRHCDGSA
jgi:hypothetical protein